MTQKPSYKIDMARVDGMRKAAAILLQEAVKLYKSGSDHESYLTKEMAEKIQKRAKLEELSANKRLMERKK